MTWIVPIVFMIQIKDLWQFLNFTLAQHYCFWLSLPSCTLHSPNSHGLYCLSSSGHYWGVGAGNCTCCTQMHKTPSSNYAHWSAVATDFPLSLVVRYCCIVIVNFMHCMESMHTLHVLFGVLHLISIHCGIVYSIMQVHPLQEKLFLD